MGFALDCVKHLAELAGISADRNAAYDWPEIEESVGLRLPEDYKLLVESLPDGWFREFVRLLRPEKSREGWLEFPDSYNVNRLQDMRQWRSDGRGVFPYPIYPEPGGLLPWGTAIRGALFFWLTGPGEPDDWPVITATVEWDYWDRFDGTVCEFLVEVAAGRYDASGFTDAPIVQVVDASGTRHTGQRVNLETREPVFKPIIKQPPALPPPGPRADFWPRRLLELGADRLPVNEFATLRELIGPAPAGVRKVDWPAVQARLGCGLPSDYRGFVDTYGPGTFGDVRIAAPWAGRDWDLFALLERKSAEVRGLTRHEWNTPIYPEPGGVISWGETTGGYTCGWAPTSPDPDQWSVVAIMPGMALGSFTFQPGLSFSAMLKEHKEHAEEHPGLDLGIIPPRDPSAGNVRFTPGQPDR